MVDLIFKSKYAFTLIGLGVLVLHSLFIIFSVMLLKSDFRWEIGYIFSGEVLFSGQKDGILFSVVIAVMMMALNIWQLLSRNDGR